MASKGKTLKLLTSQLLTQFDNNNSDNNMFELEESEIWHSDLCTTLEETMVPTSHSYNHSSRRRNSNNITATSKLPSSRRSTCSSLPVNIPDWSKVHGKEKDLYGDDEDTDHDQYNWDEEEGYSNDGVSEGNGNGLRVPPHEYLARQRGASFSVHEGRGRTLKGRDLRQVRNAVWKKFGFED